MRCVLSHYNTDPRSNCLLRFDNHLAERRQLSVLSPLRTQLCARPREVIFQTHISEQTQASVTTAFRELGRGFARSLAVHAGRVSALLWTGNAGIDLPWFSLPNLLPCCAGQAGFGDSHWEPSGWPQAKHLWPVPLPPEPTLMCSDEFVPTNP